MLACCGGCRHVILKRKQYGLAAAAILDVPSLLAEVSFDSTSGLLVLNVLFD